MFDMKTTDILLTSAKQSSTGILLLPDQPKEIGVILAHGAGGNMHAQFIRYFHQEIADAGYPCLKFNFFYSEAKRKIPDNQKVLISCYAQAIQAMPAKRVVIGGKSMGGRIASYLGATEHVAGLLFLGYPLHPPGKHDQLRDSHLYLIRKPMFFASGTKDPFARFDLLESTIRKIGRFATMYAIENGGHSFEVPKKSGQLQDTVFASARDAILKWLERL